MLKKSLVSERNPVRRLDSQHFSKAGLAADAALRSRPHGTVASLSASVESFGAYALTNEFKYQEEGIPFLRCLNIKNGFVTFGDALHIDEDAHELLHKSAVLPETVMLTMSGSVGNAAVALPSWSYPINSNQDIAKIVTKSVDPYYLVAFLGGRFGQAQMERMPVGSVQQHIFLWMIEQMLVPRLGRGLEDAVSKVTRQAYAQNELSSEKLLGAEQKMEAALGVADWSPPEPLAYTASSKTALQAGRLDAQFFSPRVVSLLKQLSAKGVTIGDVAPARHDRFSPGKVGSFNYIEIGDLDGQGTAGSTALEMCDAPSRATWRVRSKDIVTSTVRPIRRLSAMISPEQDGFICSSGFVVLEPKGVSSEVLLTFLRLPVICELMDLYCSASMYPALAEEDLLGLPIVPVNKKTESAISAAVQASWAAKHKAKTLLDAAKRAVEIAIEDSEVAALKYLTSAGA